MENNQIMENKLTKKQTINNNYDEKYKWKWIDTTVKQIEDFEFNQNSTFLAVWKRNSGKSVLVLNLINHLTKLHEFKYMYVMGETTEINPQWAFVDKNFKSRMTDDKLYSLFKLQEKQLLKNDPYHCLLILDDVKLTDGKSKPLNDIFWMGRHYKITIIVSVQFSKMLVSPLIRNNIDYLFFSQVWNDVMEWLYKSVSTNRLFKNLMDFEIFVDENNDNYQFIYYDNTTHDKNKRLSIIKAKLLDLQINY